MPEVLVINPNSNQSVTDNMSEAVDALRLKNGPVIRCVTLAEGPFGIETQKHIDDVVDPLVSMTSASSADAFVIGCYSDPGLAECRIATSKPVFGLQQAAILTAIQSHQNFGVLAMSDASIARHLKYIEVLGLSQFLCNERPLNLSVDDGRKPENYGRIRDVAKLLVNVDGAECLILGCAGLACHRAALQDDLGVTVIDPVQAATAQALISVLTF